MPAWRTIAGHPRFGEAVTARARAGLAQFRDLPPAQRWVLGDGYTVALWTMALTMQAVRGEVTAAALTRAALAAGICSRGQVRQAVDRAQSLGLLAVPCGECAWTQRPMTLRPALAAPIRSLVIADAEAATRVLPSLTRLPAALTRDDGWTAYLRAGARLAATAGRSGLRRAAVEPGISFFLGRKGGGRLLQALSLMAPSESFSQALLAREIGVSRIHLNRTLAEGVRAGYLVQAGDLTTFSPTLAEAWSRHHARAFDLARRLAAADPRILAPEADRGLHAPGCHRRTRADLPSGTPFRFSNPRPGPR